MTLLDYIVILLYLIIVLGAGLYVALKRRRRSTEGFFLADRSLNWAVIGAAMFAANISTIQMVGLAEQGYTDGLVWGNFEWMAVFLLIMLGLIFAPFYFHSKISTLPEFMERRYSPYARSMLALISLTTALFVHIGISLYAGAVVFENFFGIDRYVSILVIAGITLVYTMAGGLQAVVITEVIQTGILIVGAIVLVVLCVLALPAHGITSWAALQAAVKPHQLSMIQSHPGSALPWWTVILGYPVLGLTYWCADQTIVQKVLGARTLKDAQTGPMFAGVIKILPVFIMVFPGIFASVLFGGQIADPKSTLPELIVRIMPVGLKGLMAAALLAALMSTIAAALNSSGTLVSMDIVKKLRPHTTDAYLINIGRITILAVIVLAVAWSPLINAFPSIFVAINDLLAVLSPPISAVLLWGVFWRRGTKQAGTTTLVTGFLIGVVAFVIDFAPIMGRRVISDVWGIHFMMKAWWLFVLCSLLYFVVSLLTPRPAPESIEGLTLEKPLAFITRGRIQGITDPRVFAAVLLAVMAVLYFLFR
jgi:solute:Na+ symporter, SSS family